MTNANKTSKKIDKIPSMVGLGPTVDEFNDIMKLWRIMDDEDNNCRVHVNVLWTNKSDKERTVSCDMLDDKTVSAILKILAEDKQNLIKEYLSSLNGAFK